MWRSNVGQVGSGVLDFRVKTLEEIKAEKRRRKGNPEPTAGVEEKKGGVGTCTGSCLAGQIVWAPFTPVMWYCMS